MCILLLLDLLALRLCSYIGLYDRKQGRKLLYGTLLAWTAVYINHAAFPYWRESLAESIGFWAAMAGYAWCTAIAAGTPAAAAAALRHRYRKQSGTVMKTAVRLVYMALLAAAAWGFTLGSLPLTVVKKDFSYANLPKSLNGYKIAQISDMHMGVYISAHDFSKALDEAAAAGADKVVITGDLVDEMSMLEDIEPILKEKSRFFPDGIDYIYGNHEHRRDFEAITDMLRRTPVRILKNEAYLAKEGAVPFYIAGVDYPEKKGKEMDEERQEYMKEAMAFVPPGAFTLLLAHHSDCLEDGFSYAVPLTLAGHTHGGQITIGGKNLFSFGYPYLRGTYSRGESVGYVNRGAGHWLPIRIGCSREITIFTLHANVNREK